MFHPFHQAADTKSVALAMPHVLPDNQEGRVPHVIAFRMGGTDSLVQQFSRRPLRHIPLLRQKTGYGQEAARLHGWTVKEDGKGWRRVVPSPKPLRIVEIEAVRRLAESGFVVISTGGGGAPVVRTPEGLAGTEAVIDKDYAGSILAAELNADRLIIATDVEGVFENWGTPDCRLIRETTPAALEAQGFSAGSMGPKVEAASQFVRTTGKTAVIGRLEDIENLVAGSAGTVILPD